MTRGALPPFAAGLQREARFTPSLAVTCFGRDFCRGEWGCGSFRRVKPLPKGEHDLVVELRNTNDQVLWKLKAPLTRHGESFVTDHGGVQGTDAQDCWGE